MIVNNANVALLTTAYKASFQRGFAGVPPLWKDVATMIPSMTAAEMYAWLGQFPRLREWIGDRVHQSIRVDGYQLVNKNFEATVDVPRTAIEDDQWGVFGPLMESMGNAAATHPDEQIFGALLANGKCFDGQNFFDPDHPVGKEGAEVMVSNVQAGAGPRWYLLDTTRPLKPLIYQKRKEYEFVTKFDPRSSDRVFERNEYTYGVDGRMAAGYGFWQMAAMSGQPVTADNVEALYLGMTKLESNEGRKLGVKPNIMLCGPSTYFAARQLIEAQIINATSNTLYKLIDVKLIPYLD